jgi:putative hydrolase of the HAD superfamily
MLQAIVFDLGGTLIDYAGGYDLWPDMEGPGLAAAYAVLHDKPLRLPAMETFRRIGYIMLPDRWQQATLGQRNLTVQDLIQEIVTYLRINGVKPEWVAEAAEAYENFSSGRTEIMPHAQTVLADLKAQGYKLGLISNTMFRGRAHLEDLARFGLHTYFDALLFSGDVNLWKPRAETFHHILNELDIPAHQSVFVGDDPASDVVGGRNAGMFTVYYQSNSRFPTPDGVVPHATITGLEQLPASLAYLVHAQ